MIKFITMILMSLIFISCASINTVHESKDSASVIKSNSCYVKWSKPEYKEMYEKGLSLTREEKSEQDLLIPVFNNEVFLVFDKIDSTTYAVRYPLSKVLSDRIEKIIDQNFVLSPGDTARKNLMQSLAFLTYKITEADLKNSLQGFELVDCEKYQDSLFL